ncbi:MAG: tetratricopeptide repeat protein [Proteobacteria bacterium]|nr:tetratricopeptide repeat protein [Pseudomonadota bacterium]
MTIPLRFMTIALAGFLAAGTGCASLTGRIPEGPTDLPEGHPEMKEAPLQQPDPMVDAYAAFFRGLLLEQDGRFEEAIESLETAARSDSRSPAPLVEIMRIQMEAGNLEDAEKTGRRALEIDRDLGKVHIALGQIYLDSDRVDKALEHLLEGTRLEPDNTGALFPLAEAMEKSGDGEGAISVLEKLTADREFEALARFHLARILVGSGRTGEAADHLFRAAELNPSFIGAIGELGAQMEKQGQAESAILLYEAYLTRDPQNNAVRGFLARACFIKGEYPRARDQSEIIIETDPENTTGLLILGLSETRLGDYESALETFKRLREVSGEGFETLMQIGSAQRELEMYSEAAATFEEAVRIYPDRFEPHLNLAIIHDAMENMTKAEESARKALSLAPERSNLRIYLAQILTRQGHFAEAISLLEEGLKIAPGDTGLLYQMGITYDQSGRFDLAEKILERLLETDPDHADALNYLGYSWADRGLRLEKALEMIEKALRLRPDAAYIVDSLGWVHYRMGHYEEALKHLLVAVEKMGDDPTVLDHLGDTYEKLGQEELAVLYWSRALAADPDNPEIRRKLRDRGIQDPLP